MLTGGTDQGAGPGLLLLSVVDSFRRCSWSTALYGSMEYFLSSTLPPVGSFRRVEYLTVAETARALGISERRVRQLAGRLGAVRHADGSLRFPTDVVREEATRRKEAREKGLPIGTRGSVIAALGELREELRAIRAAIGELHEDVAGIRKDLRDGKRGGRADGDGQGR
ncbi:hypothetical protein C3Y87_06690 [Carbonactinospora thermoautotrophica]|nr:hypothetical protein [Carbonactinospora thermoautotrophica]